MLKIMIKCLSTGQAVPTGMVTDQPAWNKLVPLHRGFDGLAL
jgi:hypothetical protein